MPLAEAMMESISSLTLNRLSVYLRALRQLDEEGARRISSRELANRFQLSAAQIRKDLAQFGELGIRGVGYEVGHLRRKLEAQLGLRREHRAIIVGAGNIGSALAQFPGLNSELFKVVGIVDIDPARIGVTVGRVVVRPSSRPGRAGARHRGRAGHPGGAGGGRAGELRRDGAGGHPRGAQFRAGAPARESVDPREKRRPDDLPRRAGPPPALSRTLSPPHARRH